MQPLNNSNPMMQPNQPDVTSIGYFVKLSVIVMILLVSFIFIWGSLAPLSSAAVATGSVVVEGNIKEVQHLEGGIVESIEVENGDFVSANQKLISLDTTQQETELAILLSQYYENLAKKARLEAERDDLEAVTFDPQLQENQQQELMQAQLGLFAQRKDRISKEKTILFTKIDRIKEQIIGYQKLVKNKQAYLDTLKSELKDTENLYARDLVSMQQVREVQRSKITMEGEVAELENNVASAKVEIVENEEQILLNDKTFKEEILSELDAINNKLNDLDARKVSIEDRLSRTQIIAPVSGVVEGLSVFAKRAVVSPGQLIMSIVPQDAKQIIEAKVEPTDIDKVTSGLKAEVRFSAYNSQDVFLVEGEVFYVSADKQVNQQNGSSFYTAKLTLTEEGKRQAKANGFELKTGMPVEVVIKTGERTFLSYLLKPFSTMMSRAFNED